MAKTFRARTGIFWSAFVVVWLAFVTSGEAATRSFTNGAAITIPAMAGVEAASPYPSLVTVSNLPGVVRRVTVELHGLAHENPDDLDILLVGPNGAAVLLMSDAGGTTDISGVELTFDDAAASPLPDMSAIVSGTFRPTSFPPNPDVFPDPAPGPPFANGLPVFAGTSPNGSWRLFVRDDLNSLDTGSLDGGWTLNITTDVLRINEWLILNSNNLADPNDGQFESWFELFNPGPLSVDLGSFYLTDDLNDPAKFRLPAGTNIPPGGRKLVWADGETNQNPAVDLHASFTLSGDGGVIGLFSGEGALVDAIAYGPQAVNISQGRCPDSAPDIRTQGIPTPRASNECCPEYITLTDRWKYDASGMPPDPAWKLPGYFDTFWASGRGLFHNETAPLPAPTNTFLPLITNGAPILSYYFRTHFTNDCPTNPGALFASMVLDDGAIVYLNGVEVSRRRMPPGPVGYTTLATTVNDATLEGSPAISTNSLLPGDNLLAVEVHQDSTNSSDVVFGLALGWTPNLTPLTLIQPPLSQTVTAGTTVTLSVEASGPEPLRYRWLWNGGLLLGATNSTLVLSNAQPNDGGWYAVIVSGTAPPPLLSPPAFLLVQPATNYPFSDTFGASAQVTNAAGVATTNNLPATRQTGEPLHAGKPGTNSMWFRWKSDVDGVVTFSTHGSDFDTLLAAYTGTDVGSLTPLASSDDSGGRITSRIRFNVAADETNHIAIAGFNDARGNIVLNWSFAPDNRAPLILDAPTNRAVRLGTMTTFRVGASQASTYQWFLNDTAIPGATADTHVIPSVQPDHLGAYTVRVTNSMNAMAFTESLPARLEIGPVAHLVSVDKREDLFPIPPPGDGLFAHALQGVSPAGGAAVGASVAAGTADMQIFDISGSTIVPGDTVCSQAVTATRYYGLTNMSTTGLTFVIDTKGSLIDVGLEVRHSSGLVPVEDGCTTEGEGEIRFEAMPATIYEVKVGSLEGASLDATNDVIQVNWRLGSDPVITNPPTSVTVVSNPAASVTFTNLASGVPPPTNQWQVFTNDAWLDISGANAETLVVPAIRTSQYRAVATNFMSAATSSVATLTVLVPPAVTVQPQSLTVTQGNTATFSGTAAGTEPLTYQWLANGIAWPGATSNSFSLDQVTTNLSGTSFSLLVTNAAGWTLSSNATLTVWWAPVILSAPQSLTANQDSDVTFSMPATANPLPAYQWTRHGDGSVLSTMTSLFLSNVQPSHSGTYLVAITNEVGGVIATNTLTVIDPRPVLRDPMLLTNGLLAFTLSGQAGYSYAVEISDDLVVWTAWLTNLNGSGLLRFTNSVPDGTSFRAFRSRMIE